MYANEAVLEQGVHDIRVVGDAELHAHVREATPHGAAGRTDAGGVGAVLQPELMYQARHLIFQ